MNHDDRFEIELASLRPRKPSLELKHRIANRLSAAAVGTLRRQPNVWRGSALVGGLLAASLAAVVAWDGRRSATNEVPLATHEVDVATAFDESLPSLWSYRRTLTQQTQSVSGLLDRHASRRHEKGPSAAAFVLARSSFDVDTLTGEL